MYVYVCSMFFLYFYQIGVLIFSVLQDLLVFGTRLKLRPCTAFHTIGEENVIHRSDENPVSILSGNKLLVLNKDLWKYVALEYKADRDILERKYHYGFFEKSYSFKKLKSSINAVALLEEYGDEGEFKSSLSRLVIFVWGSCFWARVYDFMDVVISAPEDDDDIELSEDLVELFRVWGKVSKAVYEGKKFFMINEAERSIGELRDMLTLMDSKKEDRVLMLGEGPKDLVEGSWCEVADLKPNMRKLKLLVEVLSNEVIVKKGEWKTKRLNHCLVADGSASVLFCARNEQVDLLVPGTKALLRNAEVQMYMDRIYLVVGSEGDIVDDISAEADFKVNLAQNVSDKIY